MQCLLCMVLLCILGVLCGFLDNLFLLSVHASKKKKKLIRPKLVGVFQASCVCVIADFIASGWAWLHEPTLGHWGHWGAGPGCGDRWACSGFGVTLRVAIAMFLPETVM